MIIDVLGWLMIAIAIYIVFASFKSKQGKTGFKILIRLLSIMISFLLIVMGAFFTGHSGRVKAQHKAAIASSLSASKKASSIESSTKNAYEKSSNKANSSGDISAFEKSVNELATNKGATAKVNDSEVQIIVNDDAAGNDYATKKQLANDYISRIDKIANMCNLGSVPYVYIQTQSGKNIARSTLTGGIKIYN